ncbi:right-handed parallel beta-helix repeat-containing protein [Shewanella submarina]|uniref:Right-handed parallel beta-helix repeat-containing protein n=1 Tax=Shewanella submarina TaxID=2016376 RepID=A0ABV7GC41_9GAMM|nr:right-handed parallel beta-helix repeat-containing protein [Shewanella submarina]MCL1037217.1 right-handed parallel beta-helix repeat-containing protein [Shewanella submarina]
MKRRTFIKSISGALATASVSPAASVLAADKRISIADFGLKPNSRDDAVPALKKALAYCKQHPGTTLVFPYGRYDFWNTLADRDFYYISNNDDGIKPVAFPLVGFSNTTIDGQGSRFVFHGGMVPAIVRQSKGITLKNFSIDWDVPFHCEGIIEAVNQDESYVDIRIKDGFSYKVENNRFIFVGEGFENPVIKNLLEFDTELAEQAYMARDNFQREIQPVTTEIRPGVLRLQTKFASWPKVGNTLLVMQERRDWPAIAVQETSNTWLEQINIHHSGAMGVIGQLADGIHLDRVQVVPARHSGRIVSTTVDATHFVNCRGHIVLKDCLFQGQIDDGTNIHGMYGRVAEIHDKHRVTFELVHYQQLGIDIFNPGSQVNFSDKALRIFHHNQIVETQRNDAKYWTVTFKEALPASLAIDDVMDNMSWQPEQVLISGTRFAKNRARGALISAKGNIVIENNYFHTPGIAIKIGSGGVKWYESGPVQSVQISNNLFDNCNYAKASSAIDIVPGRKSDVESAFHQNVRIHDNEFRVFNERVLTASRTHGVLFVNNKIQRTEAYPMVATKLAPLQIDRSTQFVYSDNEFVGFDRNKKLVSVNEVRIQRKTGKNGVEVEA